MPLLKSRVPFTPQNPYRVIRPKTSKIIFLSCEGSVTEEEYFPKYIKGHIDRGSKLLLDMYNHAGSVDKYIQQSMGVGDTL